MEIYNEKVRDLLQPVEHQRKGDQPALHTLKLREHPKDGPYVQGECPTVVTCFIYSCYYCIVVCV